MPHITKKILYSLGSDVVEAIDKAWKRDSQNGNEAVLVFNICDCRSDPTDIIPIIPVVPPPLEGKPSCTYIDCSWIQFGRNDTVNAEEFAALAILSKYLKTFSYIKIILVAPYDLFTEDGAAELKKRLLLCPAVFILSEVNRYCCFDGSFGLVTLKQTQTVKKDKNSSEASLQTSTAPAEISIRDLRDDFRNRLISLRRDQAADRITGHDEQFMQSYERFFSVLVSTKNYLILHLNRYWDKTIKNLVRVPSPPGYKILQFCTSKRYFHFTNGVSGEVFWQIYNNHGAAPFNRIAGQLAASFAYKVGSIGVPLMRSVIGHFLLEVKSHPERENQSIELTSKIWNTIKMCQDDKSTGVFDLDHLLNLTGLLGYPVEDDIAGQLENFKAQKSLVQEMSCSMQLQPSPQTQKNLFISYKKFVERLENEVMPILASNLQHARVEVCKHIQTEYEGLNGFLVKLLGDGFVSETIVNEELRLEAIEIVNDLAEVLNPLKTGASPSSILTAYINKERRQDCVHANNFETMKEINKFFNTTLPQILALESQHNQLEKAIEMTKTNYVSCGNHSAHKIFQSLRNQLSQAQGTLIRCNELVFQIRNEVKIFVSSVISNFEEKQIVNNLTRKSVSDKLDNILTPVRTKVSQILSQDSHKLPEVLKLLSHVFRYNINISSGETVVSTVRNFEDDLTVLLESEQLNMLKSRIFKECKSPLFKLESKIFSWRNCFLIFSRLDERLTAYEHQVIASPKLRKLLVAMAAGTFSLLARKVVPELSVNTDFLEVACSKYKQVAELSKQIVYYSVEGNMKLITAEIPMRSIYLVTGNYVRFSDFVEKPEAKKLDVQEIRIFATEKVFIDQDVYDEIGRELQVTIVSPVVEIFGVKREIRLCGRDGAGLNHYDHYYTQGGRRSFPTRNFRDGLPGKPGGNGGHCYLVCKNIVNSSVLHINVQGGNGGTGQNGECGEVGSDGVNAGPWDSRDGEVHCRGSPGNRGGNGGDGGAGGCPGIGGSIEVELFSDTRESIRKTFGKGKKGQDGKGGPGGVGGREGKGYIKRRFLFFNLEGEYTDYGEREGSGCSGTTGRNSTGQELPPNPRKPVVIERIIPEYRKFVMNQSMIHGCNFPDAQQLLEKLDVKTELSNMSPLVLATDLLNMELVIGRGPETQNDRVIHDYRQFQERLARYTQWWNETLQQSKEQENSLVLELLSAYSTSKILVLEENSEALTLSRNRGVHVVNLQAYFEHLSEKVNRLKSGHVELNRQESLQRYDKHIREKCENTGRFLSKVALPAVAKAQKEISESLQDCIRELNKYYSLLEQERNQRHVDQRTIETIENSQRLQTLLKFIQCVANLVEIFAPVAPVVKVTAGIVSKATTSISGLLYKCTQEYPMTRQEVRLPQCLENLVSPDMKERGETMHQQIGMIDTFLETLDEESDIATIVRPLLGEWRNTLERCQMLNHGHKLHDDNVNTCLAEMECAREKTVEALEKIAVLNNSSNLVLTDLNRLLARLALINFNVHQRPTEDIAEKRNTAQVNTDREHAIFQRQQHISAQLMPLIDSVIGSSILNKGDGNFKEKKWKMQSVLRELKEKTIEFVRGLGSENKLRASLETVHEALNLIIDLHDEMDAREESLKQVEVTYALSCQNVDFVSTVNDKTLRKTLFTLGYHLKANVFRVEYNRAVKAFNQWMFPFANKFFPQHDSSLSSDSLEKGLTTTNDVNDDSNYNENLKSLTSFYIEKFEELKDNVDRYKALTMDIDAVVHTGIFSNASKKVNPPFYTWKGTDYEDEIERLLRGEEVQLRADIFKAKAVDGGRRGAVKFKSVHLFLKHRKGFYSKEQKELNGLLHASYMISLTHSGISYYRVFDQGFVMRGSQQEFRHSFDKSTANAVYEKNKSSEHYLLSPYTVWGIRLINVASGGSGGSGDYTPLEKFKGHLNLVLEGDGWYVDEVAAKEKELDKSYLRNLEKYYELAQFVSS